VKGDTQQPALPATADKVAEVQERLGHDLPIADDTNPTRLLDDEEAATVITRVHDLDRSVEAIGHEVDFKVDLHRLDSSAHSPCPRDERGHHQRDQQADTELVSTTPC
jgi:hypothetical protein